MVEGSGIQSKKNKGFDVWAKHYKKIEELTFEADMRSNWCIIQ
jgi:hypothetical protein